MKKIIITVLSILVVLALGVSALAAVNCSVVAVGASVTAGETVTVPVNISGNGGFTNFSIIIDYDSDALELLGIDTSGEEGAYLCGDMVSVNTAYEDENGKSVGFITCALTEKCAENGTLFTVTFKVKAGFEGSAEVTPVVNYIRNNAAVFSVFEEMTASVTGCVITVSAPEVSAVKGDFNGDGVLDVFDVSGLYNAIMNGTVFTDEEIAALDMTGDGGLDVFDVAALYQAVMMG